MANAPKTQNMPAQMAAKAADTATSAVNAAAKTVANEAKSFDVTRPFRMLHHFATGSFSGMLNGMARWCGRGGTAGFVGGVLFGIANAGAISFIGAVGIGLLAGAGAGAVLGGALGLASGGATRASRAQASEDAKQRRHAPAQHHDAVTARTQYSGMAQDSNFERTLQQNQEFERNSTYWQDRVAGSSQGQGRGF